MKYLTVEQALGDAANFIQQMNKAYNFTSEKWIAFGGSYGGALVVWMRVRYPNLVYGGVSSSGPIAPVVNFKSKTNSSLIEFMPNGYFTLNIFRIHARGFG